MISGKSLWARYKEETSPTRFIEYDWGFISYTFVEEECIYLEDVYVVPERRFEKLGLRLVEEAEAVASAAGRSISLACINLNAKTAAESMKAHLAVGFVPFRAEDDKIWLKRSIRKKE